MVPGSDKSEQFERMMKECLCHVGGFTHMVPVLKAVNDEKQQTEDDFVPKKTDPKLYSKTITTQALDEDGNVLKHTNNKPIMVDMEYVHKPEKKEELWQDYDSDRKIGKEEYRKYKLAEQSITPLFEHQFEASIWSEITHYENFDTYWKDFNVVECIKIMRKVCGSSCNESLKFKAAEVLRVTENHLNIKQGKKQTVANFCRILKKRSETLALTQSAHFGGMGRLAYIMNKEKLKLKDYFDPSKVNEAKRRQLDDASLDLTNAMIFMRGCRCHPDKQMRKNLESEYAHGNNSAYLETLYGMLKLYRAEYETALTKKSSNQNLNSQKQKENEEQKNDEDTKDDDEDDISHDEDDGEDKEEPEDDAINAHMEPESDSDDAKAETMLAAHVDDGNSIQVGWVNETQYVTDQEAVHDDESSKVDEEAIKKTSDSDFHWGSA